MKKVKKTERRECRSRTIYPTTPNRQYWVRVHPPRQLAYITGLGNSPYARQPHNSTDNR